MLNLTLRQIKILDHLLQSEVSFIDDLLSYAKISSRTLQSEISIINQELQASNIAITIKANRGRGYCAEPNDENRAVYEELKRQCQTYLNHELTMRFGDNPRTAILIRVFLCAKDYIKAEELQDGYHISTATLTNDLRYVRQILEAYGIQLQSTPYYGMKIVGDPLAVRCALIDFCDLYDIYTENHFFPQYAFRQYGIEPDRIPQLRIQFSKLLKEEDVHLQEQGFSRLFFYLLIKGSGYDSFPLNEIEVTWHDSTYHNCACKLLQLFGIEEQEEAMFVELLLLIHREHIQKEILSQVTWIAHVDSMMGDLVYFLHRELHLDLGRKVHIIDELHSFLYRCLWKSQYHLHFFNHPATFRTIIKDIPVSTSLTYQILEYLRTYHGILYDSDDFISCVIPLFNAIFIVPNEYHMVKVAFLGPFSESSTASVSCRLSTDARHNVHHDYYSFYELDTIDFSQYDCVFAISAGGIILKDCPCKVFYGDYLTINQLTNDFFNQVVVKHRIENFLLYKTDNSKMFSVSNLQEVFQILSTYGYLAEHKETIMQKLLMDNAIFYQQDPFVICLLWKEELAHTLFIFDFTTPLWIEDHKLHQLQIVIMDPNDNVLAVKQADSYVRRMQRSSIL